jgi:triacylglycerol lipase
LLATRRSYSLGTVIIEVFSIMSTTSRPIVLLVHGIGHNAEQTEPLANYLRAQGLDCFGMSLEPTDATEGLDILAQQVDAAVRRYHSEGRSVHLVGFSMGGLVSRLATQKYGSWKQLKSLITIASPHHGTIMALWRTVLGVIQMRPWSDLVLELNEEIYGNPDWKQPGRPYFKQIWTILDHLIIPPMSGRLPIGKNKLVWVAGHNQLITSERVFHEVHQGILMGESLSG